MFRFSIPPLLKTPRLLVIREISSLPYYSITLLSYYLITQNYVETIPFHKISTPGN